MVIDGQNNARRLVSFGGNAEAPRSPARVGNSTYFRRAMESQVKRNLLAISTRGAHRRVTFVSCDVHNPVDCCASRSARNRSIRAFAASPIFLSAMPAIKAPGCFPVQFNRPEIFHNARA